MVAQVIWISQWVAGTSFALVAAHATIDSVLAHPDERGLD